MGLGEEREDDSEKEMADVLLLLSPSQGAKVGGAQGGGSCDIGETGHHPLLNLHIPEGWTDKVVINRVKRVEEGLGRNTDT